MARKAPKMAADGLPEPLPMRPVFRPLSLVLGAVAGVAIVFLMQQSGSILLTTGWIAAGAIGGLLLGVLLPSLPYLWVARRVNGVVAQERQKRASMSPAPPQGGA